jgi:DNA-damage-inducible protein J
MEVVPLAQVNIRIEDDLKEEADIVLSELGLNMTTAFNIFIRQTVREGGIPFAVTTKPDPFYNIANLRILRQSIKEANEGKLTAHELIKD